MFVFTFESRAVLRNTAGHPEKLRSATLRILPTLTDALRKKIRTRANFKKTPPYYISVESLVNVVFDKNIILATFSLAKRQKPVQTEMTADSLVEFIGYWMPQ